MKNETDAEQAAKYRRLLAKDALRHRKYYSSSKRYGQHGRKPGRPLKYTDPQFLKTFGDLVKAADSGGESTQ